VGRMLGWGGKDLGWREGLDGRGWEGWSTLGRGWGMNGEGGILCIEAKSGSGESENFLGWESCSC
jgi:hypothetical protein